MSSKSDFYDLLGVSKTSSQEEIKKSYRKKALEWHPDRNKSPEAEAKFKEINQAYEILSDPTKRQTYDQFGHAAFSPGAGFPGGGFSNQRGAGPFSYSYSSNFGGASPFGDAEFTDPFEIFEQFFGGGSPFGRQAARRDHYSIKVDFMDAIKGGEKTVVIQGKEHTIKIPKGASEGTRLRFENFDISIDIAPHPKFKRDGQDLYIDHHINLSEAILGANVSVPTIDGVIKIKVRPGTQSHTMVRLQGLGVPYLNQARQGDQYIRMIVDIPEKVTKKQRQLIEQFAKNSS